MMRRVGPWITPTLVVVEVVLVVSGVLDLTRAILIAVVLEVLIGLTAISRLVVGYRSFRRQRRGGGDVWQALEDALAELMPRRAARFIVLEPRSWASLRRLGSRHDPASFGSARGLRAIFIAVFALTLIELGVLELVLFLAVDSAIWRWLSVAVHVYALAWLASFWASFVANPHRVEEESVVLRDGLFATIVVPLTSIGRATTTKRSSPGFGGRTGVWIDDDAGRLTLAIGPETNVVLHLCGPVWLGDDERSDLTTMALTLDDPAAFVAAVREKITPVESR